MNLVGIYVCILYIPIFLLINNEQLNMGMGMCSLNILRIYPRELIVLLIVTFCTKVYSGIIVPHFVDSTSNNDDIDSQFTDRNYYKEMYSILGDKSPLKGNDENDLQNEQVLLSTRTKRQVREERKSRLSHHDNFKTRTRQMIQYPECNQDTGVGITKNPLICFQCESFSNDSEPICDVAYWKYLLNSEKYTMR